MIRNKGDKGAATVMASVLFLKQKRCQTIVLMKVIVSKDHFYDKIFYILFLKSPSEGEMSCMVQVFIFKKSKRDAFFTFRLFHTFRILLS